MVTDSSVILDVRDLSVQRRGIGAVEGHDPVDIERAAEDLKTCDLILLQLEVPVETVYAAIAFGKRHGVKTLLNPAPV